MIRARKSLHSTVMNENSNKNYANMLKRYINIAQNLNVVQNGVEDEIPTNSSSGNSTYTSSSESPQLIKKPTVGIMRNHYTIPETSNYSRLLRFPGAAVRATRKARQHFNMVKSQKGFAGEMVVSKSEYGGIIDKSNNSNNNNNNNKKPKNKIGIRTIRRPIQWLGLHNKRENSKHLKKVILKSEYDNDASGGGGYDGDDDAYGQNNNSQQHFGLLQRGKSFIIEFLQGSSIHGFIYLAKFGLNFVER